MNHFNLRIAFVRNFYVMAVFISSCLAISCTTTAPRTQHQRDRPNHTVVLVPGLHTDRRLFDRLQSELKARGYRPLLAEIRTDGWATIPQQAEQLRRQIVRTIPPHENYQIIAFSMGGLTARYLLQQMGEAPRVQTLTTLGTPHQGTLLAHFVNQPAVREMKPNSDLLRQLERTLPRLQHLRLTSIWSDSDGVIWPSNSATLPVGQSLRVTGIPHARLLTSEESMQASLAQLPAPVRPTALNAPIYR